VVEGCAASSVVSGGRLVLSRVEIFERIRRDHRLEPGVSVRELARRHGVHRRTVREALGSALPPARRKPARTRMLVLGPVTGFIDAMLREDLAAPRKQRTRSSGFMTGSRASTGSRRLATRPCRTT
jgi:hypothetical protein